MYRLRFSIAIAALLLVGCANTPPSVPVAQQSPPPQIQPTQIVPTPQAQPTVPAPTTIPVQSPAPTQSAPPVSANARRMIAVTQPAAGSTISNPLTIKGTANFWPFEATLTAQVKDAAGNVLGVGPVMVNAPDVGQGGPFAGSITFTAPKMAQEGTLEVFEASAKDGSIVAITTTKIQLAAAQPTSAIQIDSPIAGAAVTLPLHVAVRGVNPNDTWQARLTFSNGQVLEQPLDVAAAGSVGYGTANIGWHGESAPPKPLTGDATLEIVRGNGMRNQPVQVRVLSEAETQLVDVAWTSGDGQLIVFKQAVPKTAQIGTATLTALLHGPTDGNLAGAQTALPGVREIVTFPGRQPDWGYEVKLIKLTIANGVATANFSKELRAYGGGAARVQMIRQQIERTLKQFPSVQQVVIQIEGQSAGVLEP